MRKIIFFSLFIFLLLFSLLCPVSSATEDMVERYDTTYTDFWTYTYTEYQASYASATGSVTVATDPQGIDNSVLYFTSDCMGSSSGGAWSVLKIKSKQPFSHSYIAFSQIQGSTTIFENHASGGGLTVSFYRVDTGALQGSIALTDAMISSSQAKYEFIRTSDSYMTAYINGVSVANCVLSSSSYSGDVYLQIEMKTTVGNNYICYTDVYFDDFTDSSLIGTPTTWNEASDNIIFTWSEQLLRSYPDSDHTISLYSITNPSNAGLEDSWALPDEDNSTGAEFGYVSFSRSNVLNLNYGLYLLEITRGSVVLADTYFYYYQLADPQGFPEILFLAESDVNAEIRDDSNNGGTISGGGSVYLYPDILEGGVYNISYDILETPYSIQAELTKIYNTTDLNGTNLLFSGLSSQNYYVSVDGTAINGTNGSDTWNYTVTWDTLDSHIVTFAPDYTLPGVYGYIKNSETQAALKSATVAISNGTFTEYMFTDDNGMYYFTQGMVPGSYNITASQSGYTTSVPYSVTTQNGSTTRQDIFLDPVSGSGVYYASHDVTFTVLEYWYSSAGLPGVSYAVYDDESESVKNGTTGSKGTFTVTDMDAGTNYTFILTYNGTTYTEYLEPGLTEYTLVLNKEGIVHQYYNSWLNLTYAENSNNVTVLYTSSKTVSEASLTVTASNGTIVQSDTLNTTSGTFTFDFTEGDYILQFNIEASDGSTASQAWSVSSPPEVTLFPASYPAWLKNTLFVSIIIIFLLAFGKSKNDIACGAAAVLTSLGYYFEWVSCSFNFVVLIWIIAIGAIFLHYKRTGAVG